jgi:hypothetical protein
MLQAWRNSLQNIVVDNVILMRPTLLGRTSLFRKRDENHWLHPVSPLLSPHFMPVSSQIWPFLGGIIPMPACEGYQDD